MSLILDRQYANLTSSYLDRFKKLGNDTFNFRCPFCGDSQKSKAKARGYFYARDNALWFHCHNCSEPTMGMKKFLDRVNPNLAAQYKLDKFKEKEILNYTEKSNEKLPEIEAPDINTRLKKISELPNDHAAVKFLKKRKIPEYRFPDLNYTENFSSFVKSNYPKYKDHKLIEEARIIIPFYDDDEKIIGFQGRAINDVEKAHYRYMTIKITDGFKIFGMNKIDRSKIVYVVEGPLDSMFFPNCIATMDSSLYNVKKVLDNVVLIYDNEPRNKEIVGNMNISIRMGMSIVVWPRHYEGLKDINDMVLAGHKPDVLLRDIEENTFSGLKGKMKIIEWKGI